MKGTRNTLIVFINNKKTILIKLLATMIWPEISQVTEVYYLGVVFEDTFKSNNLMIASLEA